LQGSKKGQKGKRGKRPFASFALLALFASLPIFKKRTLKGIMARCT
jgi:hypothetical protein